MKKFLGILAIAVTLVACDNAANSEQRLKDSTDSVRRVDSMNSAMPATPAPSTMDTTGMNTMGTDTSSMNKMSADSTQK